MRQFKIIDTSPDKKTGLITTNFALPIKMSVGSQIALDKFQCILDDATGNFSLPNQTMIVNVGPRTPDFDVFIAANNYASLDDLMIALTQATNNVWNAETPTDETIGLKLAFTQESNIVSIGFVSVAATPIVSPVVENCAADTAGIYIMSEAPSIPAEMTGDSPEIVLSGGGFSFAFNMRPDVIGGFTTIECGLSDTDNINQVKIIQAVSNDPEAAGEITFISSFSGASPQTITGDVFYPGGIPTIRGVQILQKDGYFQCIIYDTATEELLYQSTAAEGGEWDLTVPLTMYFAGSLVEGELEPAENRPGFGDFIMTVDEPVAVTPATIGYFHTVSINFLGPGGTNASLLRRALSFTDVIVLIPTNNEWGKITALTAANFSVLQGALDVAIELMDMPLETYEVGASQYPFPRTGTAIAGVRQPGARKNVIGYFLPQEAVGLTSVFTYAQSQYQWLDLANKQPLEFTSLSFRVYIAMTGVPIKCSSLSFNFLTREDYEAGKK